MRLEPWPAVGTLRCLNSRGGDRIQPLPIQVGAAESGWWRPGRDQRVDDLAGCPPEYDFRTPASGQAAHGPAHAGGACRNRVPDRPGLLSWSGPAGLRGFCPPATVDPSESAALARAKLATKGPKAATLIRCREASARRHARPPAVPDRPTITALGRVTRTTGWYPASYRVNRRQVPAPSLPVPTALHKRVH